MTTVNSEGESKCPEREKRKYCLALLREARTLILRDAEAFHEAATVLEQVGQVWGRKIHGGMAGYEEAIHSFSEDAGADTIRVGRLLNVVRNARNMAVHEGAWARHLSSRLIDLFLVLEEAIMTEMTTVGDVMVRNPVIAESWHMVAQVRREMLANSFSCLPIFHDSEWRFITDANVMHYLGYSAGRKARNNLLEANLGELIDKNGIETIKADNCHPSVTIPELLKKMRHLPVLVSEDIGGENRIVGIVTPFDLL